MLKILKLKNIMQAVVGTAAVVLVGAALCREAVTLTRNTPGADADAPADTFEARDMKVNPPPATPQPISMRTAPAAQD